MLALALGETEELGDNEGLTDGDADWLGLKLALGEMLRLGLSDALGESEGDTDGDAEAEGEILGDKDDDLLELELGLTDGLAEAEGLFDGLELPPISSFLSLMIIKVYSKLYGYKTAAWDGDALALGDILLLIFHLI
jgi:hypothetical protein